MNRRNNSLISAVVLAASFGIALAGCSETGSFANRDLASRSNYRSQDYYDQSDCNSTFGGNRTGTGANANGSSSTNDSSGTVGCSPSHTSGG